MIARLTGKVLERKPNLLVVEAGGVGYEVLVPAGILPSLGADPGTQVSLVIYHYLQIEHNRGLPVLVGFRHELERDFFEQFLRIAGMGPRSAAKALALPIHQVAEAIELGDVRALQRLPGVGAQKAREIVAKLQGRAGRFCLIKQEPGAPAPEAALDLRQEAMAVLCGLGHPAAEAAQMVARACQQGVPDTLEDLLNLAYRKGD
jgi:Holliday junction DNA helicase RuvA